MALNPTALGNALANVFSEAAMKEGSQADAINDLSQGIASTVIQHIKENMEVKSIGANSAGNVNSVSQTIL